MQDGIRSISYKDYRKKGVFSLLVKNNAGGSISYNIPNISQYTTLLPKKFNKKPLVVESVNLRKELIDNYTN
jgi:hypothetical protein